MPGKIFVGDSDQQQGLVQTNKIKMELGGTIPALIVIIFTSLWEN